MFYLVDIVFFNSFAKNKELAIAKWNEYFGYSEMTEED